MTHSILGNIGTDAFLKEYWQQKPLLIRQAIAKWPTSLEPDELAGLALEEEVRARIVLEQSGQSIWECQHGPFTEDSFKELPESHWCLLVQDIEKLLPEFSWLIDHFLFLPRWRIDDLMVSYAAPEGSVGPHVDQYDVFLLQGMGQRRWQIQQHNVDTDNLLENSELQILQDFKAEQEWLLEPGDMLYLPPGVAHYGIAVDDCITYSIGFRAPSKAELIQSLAETIVNDPGFNDHYRDQIRQGVLHPGEIDPGSLDHIRQFMLQALDDRTLVARAACTLLSEASIYLPDIPENASMEKFSAILEKSKSIQIHPAIKMLYHKTGNGLEWFIEGTAYPVRQEDCKTIMSLVDHYCLEGKDMSSIRQNQKLVDIFFTVYKNGGLIIDE